MAQLHKSCLLDCAARGNFRLITNNPKAEHFILLAAFRPCCLKKYDRTNSQYLGAISMLFVKRCSNLTTNY